MNNSQEKLDEISRKLSIVIAVLALKGLGEESVRKKAWALKKYGLKPTEIAEVLDKPLNHITAYLSQMKKVAKGKGKK